MNKVDDILERLKEQQPVIDDADALTERIMGSLPDFDESTRQPKARAAKLRWLWTAVAAAACVAFALMMVWPKQGIEPQDMSSVETASLEKPCQQATETQSTSDKPTVQTERTVAKTIQAPKTEQHEKRHGQTEEDPNLHYAVYEQQKDTLPYQDPARVDEFIAKMAEYNNVKQGELSCSAPMDSTTMSTVYVFPDKTTVSTSRQETDLFARLLQVACWYSDETPGYLLSFSHRQFFFELKDLRKQLHYRWIAERINGKILLYSTCAPIGVETSSACYQEYRDELMHTRSIHTKTLDI